MAWVRLADDFPDHPKVVRAGPLAAWLYVCGLSYANRYATDGFIPAAQVRRLADVPDAEILADRLVDAGLWERAEGGFQVHDYRDYQPSADEVKREREAAARRQAEYRARRAEARNAARNGSGDALLTHESRPSRATGAPGPGPARPGPARLVNPGVDQIGCGDARMRAPTPSTNGQAHDEASELVVPAPLTDFHAVLQNAPGYEPSTTFLRQVAERYAALDLIEEALKMASWLTDPVKNRDKKRATTRFVLGWLRKELTDQEERAQRQPPAAPSATGHVATTSPPEDYDWETDPRDIAARSYRRY